VIEQFEDFYVLLDIDSDSSAETIRKSFRAKMREWHPDMNKSSGATEHTQRLIVAYKILNDPEARKRYDTEYLRNFRSTHTAANCRDTVDAPSQTARGTTGYSDKDLERWIRTAREAAAKEARAFGSELKEQSMVAAGAIAKVLVMMIIFAIIGLILMLYQ
jgi:DnaJ-class molecular chaperone